MARPAVIEEEELGDDQVAEVVIDGHAQEDDVVLEQPRVDVVRAFPAGGLLDHHGYQRHASLLDLNISNRGQEVKRFLSNHLNLKGFQPDPLLEPPAQCGGLLAQARGLARQSLVEG
jgi:hypothetical protein